VLPLIMRVSEDEARDAYVRRLELDRLDRRDGRAGRPSRAVLLLPPFRMT